MRAVYATATLGDGTVLFRFRDPTDVVFRSSSRQRRATLHEWQWQANMAFLLSSALSMARAAGYRGEVYLRWEGGFAVATTEVTHQEVEIGDMTIEIGRPPADTVAPEVGDADS